MKNLLRNNQGNVAMTFAIALLPVIMAAGAAVDFSGLYRARSEIQTKLDAATLSAGKRLAVLSDAEIRAEVKNFLAANLGDKEFAGLKDLSITIDREDYRLETSVTGTYPTSFMRIAGIEHLDYRPASEIRTSPNGELEVVMVLDNTYSMSVDGKMGALKTSAKDFVHSFLDKDRKLANVKIGIVPFSNYVNVGLDNRRARWISVEKDSKKKICYEKRDVIGKSGCTKKTGYNDGVPYEYESCSNYTYGAPYQYCYDKQVTWRGCAGSRNYPLNLQDRKYRIRVPGAMDQYCPRRLTQLTTNVSQIEREIASMYPNGETYIPTGLVWGWRVLSKTAPFREGSGYKKAARNNIKKAIVLMTDGENQVSANLPGWYGHWNRNVDEADQWILEVCENIKKKNILLFTIGFGDIPQKALDILQSCATDQDHYVHAKDSEALAQAFANFSAQLSSLYLSK